MFAPFFAPKRVPMCMRGFFPCTRPRTSRLHVHTRKKPAKLRYPFINPIKTIQNTAFSSHLRNPQQRGGFNTPLPSPLVVPTRLTPRDPRQDIIKSLHVRFTLLCPISLPKDGRNRRFYSRDTVHFLFFFQVFDVSRSFFFRVQFVYFYNYGIKF